MRIVLTGGGTGGHIMPLIAVARELKKQQPGCHIIYIGERNGKYASLTKDVSDFDEIKTVLAGKYRRYHGESWIQKLLDVRTNLLNLRDFLYFGIGFLQSLVLLKRIKPDVLLLKGGFVGVPVGLAAAFWRQKFITHDSDALPGLANRITGRWAILHATGMPAEYYGYNPSQVRHVGVLVGNDYAPVDKLKQREFKNLIHVPDDSQVLLVTGGSGGAAKINIAISEILSELLSHYRNLHVVHQVGIGKGNIYDGISHERLHIHELLQPMYAFTGAADVVVTRAGANTMAELGVQNKATIVIPNPLLTGGHQLRNAQYLKETESAIIIDEKLIETKTHVLFEAISALLDDEDQRQKLGAKLQRVTIPDASKRLAAILLSIGTDNNARS